ncbi:MAG: SpoIIE family protein phosphatase [Pseudoxanthomonas sp.]
MPGTGPDQRSAPVPANAVQWRGSLRTSIALWSGTLNLLLLLAVVLAIAWFGRREIINDAHRNTRASAQEAAQRLDTRMRTVMITTSGLSDLVANADLDPEELTTTLRAMAKATPGVNGGLLVLEPHASRRPAFARYIATNGKDRDFIADGYDYRAQAWYQRTLASPQGWWSEPYVNQTAGTVWMVTYNLPLRPAGRGATTRGMVSLDLPLAQLTDSFETLANLPGWRVSLVAPAGLLAANPEAGVALHETLDGYIRRHGRSDLAPVANAVRLRQAGQFTHVDARMGEKRYTVVEPVGSSGWSLLVAQSNNLVVARLNQALFVLLAAGTLLALLSTLVVRRLAKRISRPVEHLAESTSRLARGQYDWPVPHTGRGDEVGRMARTLEHARLSIQQQLVEIGAMGAARQKLQSELSIARDIQHAMLSPPRLIERGRSRLQAHAVLEAAKEVGGDFYSFIERSDSGGGDGELWFAIGDVSDKGVPAALFMARAVTVMEVAAHAAAAPDQVLAEASRRLVEGNDTCMFATVLCGHIDVRSGRCTLASAGHDAPLLLHADGRVEMLAIAAGPPLGFEVSERFPLWHGVLEPGASLMAYTDGVTEAFNPDNEAYGERLLAAVRSGDEARENCLQLIADVHRFAGTAPQSDDITVLAIRLDQTIGASADTGTSTSTVTGTQENLHADTTDRPG